jgi:hypothetical protein
LGFFDAISGRTMETREEALDEAEVVCSARTVVSWAMHALRWCQSLCIESLQDYSSDVDEDEDAIAPDFFFSFFCGLDDRDREVSFVGDRRPRESSVLCSVSSSWCCSIMFGGGDEKLGMLPRARRVIAKM